MVAAAGAGGGQRAVEAAAAAAAATRAESIRISMIARVRALCVASTLQVFGSLLQHP